MKFGDLEVHTVVSAAFEENCYLVHKHNSNDSIVIDPGLEPDKIATAITQKQLNPVGILITHCHLDHAAGTEELLSRWPQAKVIASKKTAQGLADPLTNLSQLFGFRMGGPTVDTVLEDGECFQIANLQMKAIVLEGHCPGHTVFLWPADNPLVAFVGDVIFAGSVGRTDFPGGSFEQLALGIRTKLFTLPDSVTLLSGHGPPTTVGEEKRSNPFVGQQAGQW